MGSLDAYIIVEDALSSNGPHLKLLKDLNMSFITVVKPDGHKSLFDWVESFDWSEDHSKWDNSQGEFLLVDDRGVIQKFRFVNNIPINDAHQELTVNFLEFWEIDKEGNSLYHNTWITDISILQENAHMITRGGRARWHIESAPQVHKEGGFCHGLKLCA